MNESRLHLNKRDPNDRMIKKDFKGNESYYLYQQSVLSFSVTQS